MNITALSIRRPITIVMILGFFVLAGIVAFSKIPVRRLPNVNFPFLRITISDPGASAATMSTSVTAAVENALATQSGLVSMQGTSSAGRSVVALQYIGGTNISQVEPSVSLALAKIARRLPSSASSPIIKTTNPNALPMMNIAVYGHLATSQLNGLVSSTVLPAIEEIPGVASANMVGGHVAAVNVVVHQSKLNAYGISLTQVAAALKSQNASINGGTASVGQQSLPAKTNGGYQSATQLDSLPVASRQGSTIFLQNVATVSSGLAASTSHAQLNGKPAVGLVVTASSTANTLAVDHAVRQTLASLSTTLPVGVHATVTGDITNYTHAALNNVEWDLFIGIFMAGLVLLLFLHRLRNTLIVMAAIPVSLVSTIAVMYFMGFSLDLISLMALSLLIGILVDDSIVVLENIHRHRKLGEDHIQSAINGRMEIGAAAVAITLTDVVVYAPIAFLGGNVGQLFHEFGLTIVSATLFSLLVSYTLTPMLAARWGKDEATKEPGRFEAWFTQGFDKLRAGYRHAITWSLSHRLRIFAVSVVALVGSILIVTDHVLPTTFVPREDNGVLTINATLPAGTSLSLSQATMEKFGHRIQHLKGVQQVFVSTGYAAGKGGGANRAQVTVDLGPKGTRPSIYKYVKRIDIMARKFPGLVARGHVQNPLVVGGARAASINILGPNLSVLNHIAQQVVTAAQKDPNVSQVSSSAGSAAPQLTVSVNHAQAAYFGVTSATIGTAVATALGKINVPPLVTSNTAPSIPIKVTLAGVLNPEKIDQIPIPSAQGMIPLSEVASLKESATAGKITTLNHQYAVSVSASVPNGNIGNATQILQTTAQHVGIPAGYSIALGGQALQQHRAFGPLLEAFGLSILLIYMLMAALYESFFDPLVVIGSLPLATVGALLGLWVTHQALSIFSILALIMLMGLVAKNAILLIDYTKTLRKRGFDRDAALIESGSTRIRPILMTTATMIGSMLPLAVSQGSGSSERVPIAVVLIGGLLTSTLLTLVVVPVVYSLVDDSVQWMGRKLFRKPYSSSIRGIDI